MKPGFSPRALLAAALLMGGIVVTAFGPGHPSPSPQPPSRGEGGVASSHPQPLPPAGSGDGLPKNYRVIYDTDLQRLVTNVHEAMLANWQVAGGIAVYVSEGKVRYAQAMVGN